MISIAAPAVEQTDVAVDLLDEVERHLLVAVGEDPVEVAEQQPRHPLEDRQALPPQRVQPREEEPQRRARVAVVPEPGPPAP